MGKRYRVTLKINHETGKYNRGNRTFTYVEERRRVPQPQILDEAEIGGLLGDPFLEITELPDEAA